MSLVRSAKFASSGKPTGSMITARGLAANWLLGGEKNIVLCIACFAYSLLLIVVVFPLFY